MNKYYVFDSDEGFQKIYALSALMGGHAGNESKIAETRSASDLAIRINYWQDIEVVDRRTEYVPDEDTRSCYAAVQYHPGLEKEIAEEYIFSVLRVHTVQEIFPAKKVPYKYDDPYPAARHYLLHRAFAAGVKDESYGTHSGEVYSFKGEADFAVLEAGKRYHVVGMPCTGDAWTALNGHMEFTEEAEQGKRSPVAVAHFV